MKSFYNGLSISEDLTAEEAELIRFLYSGMSKKYHNQQKQVLLQTVRFNTLHLSFNQEVKTYEIF